MTTNKDLDQNKLAFSVRKSHAVAGPNKPVSPEKTHLEAKQNEEQVPAEAPSDKDSDASHSATEPLKVLNVNADDEQETIHDAVPEATSTPSEPVTPSAGRVTRSSARKMALSVVDEATKQPEIPKSMFKQSNATEEEVAKKVEANSSKSKVISKESAKLDVNAEKWAKYHNKLQKKYGKLTTVEDDENKIHQILRHFDNIEEYGPCSGATRRERWDRAQDLGLKPPKEVNEILNTVEGTTDDKYVQPVFYVRPVLEATVINPSPEE